MTAKHQPQGPVEQRLVAIRSLLQEATANRRNPFDVFSQVDESIEGIMAEIQPMRRYSPLIGELVDTWQAMHDLLKLMCKHLTQLSEVGEDDRLRAPVGDAAHVQTVEHMGPAPVPASGPSVGLEPGGMEPVQ